MTMIATKKLQLKILAPTDAGLVTAFQLKNREFMKPYEPVRPADYYTESYWQKKLFDFLIAANEDKHYCYFLFVKEHPNDIIGWINFSNVVRGPFQACHLGYNLCQDAEGKGFMMEALARAVRFMFEEKNLHRVMANYMPSNTRSERVLEKLGFVKEGLARDYLFVGGTWQDHILTSLTNSKWQRSDLR